jgi:hypothetical protein
VARGESIAREHIVGALFEAKLKIEQFIAAKQLDPKLTMGKIGLKAGFMLAFVKADTPDDAEKLKKLELATKENPRHRSLRR